MGLIEVCSVMLATAAIAIVCSAVSDYRRERRNELRRIRDEYRS